jgi:hypothetical protein
VTLSVPDFLSLAVDPVRLAILGSAARRPVDVEAIADELGLDPRRVLKELGSLVAAGLVDSHGRLDVELLREVARSVPTDAPVDPSLVDGPWSDEEAAILSRFFSGRRLTAIPAGHAKRRLVLERLAQEFEPGLRYQEREVDFTLQLFFADYAALRRYLVDEGFMTRADGFYWRTGGRFGGSTERSDSV